MESSLEITPLRTGIFEMPKRNQSGLEDFFITHWIDRYPDLPVPETQFTEIPPWLEHWRYRQETESPRCRKWIADFVWPDEQLIVEVQGGVWHKSGHSSPKGLLRDYAKALVAASGGWTFIPIAGDQLTRGPYFMELIAQSLRLKQAQAKPAA